MIIEIKCSGVGKLCNLSVHVSFSIDSLILLFAAYASPVGKKSSFEFLPLAGE